MYPTTEVDYTVRVFTGDEFGGGTDSNVFVTLYGDKGDTGERKLKDSNNRNKFERKQVRRPLDMGSQFYFKCVKGDLVNK